MHINEINKLAGKNKIAFKTHAILRMQERKISAKEIKYIFCNGEIIADYKDDFPLPSCLILVSYQKYSCIIWQKILICDLFNVV